MQKEWCYLPIPSATSIAALQASLPISSLTSYLLLQRDIQDLAGAKAFFKPSLADLHDPWLMKGMEKAIKKIIAFLQAQKHIRVYGDYDVDGTTSVSLLCKVLQKLGGHVSYYIPDRYREGYGVSEEGIKNAVEAQVDLLICVDCGTRDVKTIGEAKKAGIEVIVCDHHEPGDDLPPALAILNPKQAECQYPFRELSACGIVFKLLQALLSSLDSPPIVLTDYLDLVVLSIAADLVPIVDENRILAYHGLHVINEKSCIGVKALKNLSRPDQKLTIADIMFGLAPYINAAGRIDHAHTAVRLFMTSCKGEAEKLALTLEKYNNKRKNLDEKLIEEALIKIEQEQLDQVTTVLLDEKWSKGVIGIGASRCIEHYYRPTILFTKEGEEIVGSARSVKGYNVCHALKKCEKLLTRYGGHAYAAGLSLPYNRFATFREAFERVVNETWEKETRKIQQTIDIKVNFADLTDVFCNTVYRMRPFGPGNRQPVFATEQVIATRCMVYQDKHLGLKLQDSTSSQLWDGIAFNMASYLPIVNNRKKFSIAYQVKKQMYQGIPCKQLVIKDLKPCL